MRYSVKMINTQEIDDILMKNIQNLSLIIHNNMKVYIKGPKACFSASLKTNII